MRKKLLGTTILCFLVFCFSNTVKSQSFSFKIENQKQDFQILEIKNNADNTQIDIYSENSWVLSNPSTGNSFFIEDILSNQKYQLKSASVSFNTTIQKKSTVQLFFEKISTHTNYINLDSKFGTRGRYAYGIKLTPNVQNNLEKIPVSSEVIYTIPRHQAITTLAQQPEINLLKNCNPTRNKTIYTTSETNLQTILDSIHSDAIVYVDFNYFSTDISYKLTNKSNVTLVFNINSLMYCESMYEDVFEITNCNDIEIYNGTFKHVVDKDTKCKGYVFSITNSKDIKLFRCDINGSGAIGIKCENSKDITVTQCKIHKNSFAAYSFSTKDCSEINLLSNILENNGESGDVKFSEGKDIPSIIERELFPIESKGLEEVVSIHNLIQNERIPINKKIKAQQDSISDLQFKQNFFLFNNFLSTRNGNQMLKFGNEYYVSTNNEKDVWSKIYKDLIFVTNSPANSGNVFYGITNNSKVVKSMNGGNDWIEIMNGIPENSIPNGIYANPYNESEAFLITNKGICKTTDAGFTWQMFYVCDYPGQICIDMNNNNLMYVNSSIGISFSQDAGKTWKVISENLPKILVKGTGRTAEYKPTKANIIANINFPSNSYLMAYTDKGTYLTNDNGEHWTQINTDVIISTYIYNNEVYIAGLQNMDKTEERLPVIYKSDRNGINWTRIDCSGQNNDFIWGLMKDNQKKGIYVLTNNQKIAYLDETSKLIGLNYGVTKHSNVISKVETTMNGKKIMYALVENKKFTDIDNYGIWISNDNGITWVKSLIYEPHSGSLLRRMYISPFNPNEVWSFDKGSDYVTFDGGKSWSNVIDNYNLTNIKNVRYSDFSFDYQNKNIIYFAEGEYSYYLYRYDKSTGGSTNLRECGNSFIVAQDNNKNIITSKFEISNDGGWTWNSVLDKIKQTIEGKFSYYENVYAHTTIITLVSYTGNKIRIHLREESDSSKNIDVYSDDNGLSWYVK